MKTPEEICQEYSLVDSYGKPQKEAVEALNYYASQLKPEMPTDKEIQGLADEHEKEWGTPTNTDLSRRMAFVRGMKLMRDLISKQLEE